MSLSRIAVVGVLSYRRPAPAGNLESIFLLQSNLLYFVGEFPSADFKFVNIPHTI